MAKEITRKEEEEKSLPSREYTLCEGSVVNFFRDIAEENHSHLREAKIAYIWKNKKWMKNGGLVPGQVKVVQPFLKPVLDYDFIVIVNPKYWQLADSRIRRAMADHLLSCCGFKEDKNGNYQWCIDRPVGAEFAGVVRRHGRWNVDLESTESAWKEFFEHNKGKTDTKEKSESLL